MDTKQQQRSEPPSGPWVRRVMRNRDALVKADLEDRAKALKRAGRA